VSEQRNEGHMVHCLVTHGRGSFPKLDALDWVVRFAPESGLKADIKPCLLSATSGLMRRNEEALFNHLIGE
jgi:hypothetical protein